MVVLLYRLGRVCGCASIVPVAAIVVPARIARIIGHRKISVQRQPLTGVVRQTGAVFASLEAVAHVVAADNLAIVILDPATLDLTRARFFVARAATIPAVAYHGARGCAHGSGGDQGRVQKACFHAYSPCYSEFCSFSLRSASFSCATVVIEFGFLETVVA